MKKEDLELIGALALTCVVLYLSFKLLVFILPIAVATLILACMLIVSALFSFR